MIDCEKAVITKRLHWAALALSAGCLFPSLDGLTGDAGDAAVDVETEAPPQDAADENAFDASDASDASVDGGGETGPFCAALDASNVLICDDFDDSDASTFAKWASSTGTVVRDPSAWRSPPFCLLTSVAAADAGSPVAHLRQTFVQGVDHLTQTFDARVDQKNTSSSNVYFNLLTVISAGISVQYRFAMSSTAFSFEAHIPNGQDAATQNQDYALVPWSLGVWHHVVLDVSVSAVPATVTVTIDGIVVVGPDASAPFAVYGSGQSIDFQAGIYYASTPESGWALRFDDVLLQAQ
jgi:hypothetical protein